MTEMSTDLESTLRSDQQALPKLIAEADKRPPEEIDVEKSRAAIRDSLTWQTDKNGNRQRPQNLGTNVEIIIRKDPELGPKIWYDAFRNVNKFGETDFTDHDASHIRILVFNLYGFEPSREVVFEMSSLVARGNQRNRLIEWLGSVPWDKVPRIEDFLIRGCGAEDTHLNRAMSRKWLVQAVARAFSPGCKADSVLVLKGDQGIGKSSAFRKLAGDEYFNDSPIDIGDRRAPLQMANTWVYELSELDSLRKSEASSAKAFFSSKEDTFVPPYGRNAVTIKRHTVFCGSTNKDEFLNDPTGSRRYWVVQAGKIDLEWITENRAQIWAEAVSLFQEKGETEWWLHPQEEEMLIENNEQYNESDPWMALVAKWSGQVDPGRWFTSADCMKQALNLDPKDMNRSAQIRVADALTRLGFEKKRVAFRDERVYAWSKKGVVVVIADHTRQKAHSR